ncbi:MAG: amidohydrolase family protein [Phycisphaerales bacterium]
MDERGPRGRCVLLEPSPGSESTPGWRVLAVDSAERIATHEAADAARRVDADGAVIIPGLVNAHTHLDLTHIGPRAFDPDRSSFTDWVAIIRAERATDAASVRASVEDGIARSFAGGVVAVGDIAGVGRTEPLEVLRDSPMLGVSFVEYFGFGPRQEAAIESIEELLASTPDRADGVTRSVQPHAPYSAGPGLYAHAARAALRLGLPITTHLAETMAEREFIASCDGPFARFLDSLGLLDAHVRGAVGEGRHPIEHLRDALRMTPFLLAHVNDCPAEFLDLLAECGATVAYCPRAHACFGHERTLGAHPHRAMRRAGVRVALATDSIVSLPPERSDRITPLDDARLLLARDRADPLELLGMITTTPASALGLDPSMFRFDVGNVLPGVNAIEVGDSGQDPVRDVFDSDRRPLLLRPGTGLDETLAKLGGLGR